MASRGLKISGRVDSNGSLVVKDTAGGTQGTPRRIYDVTFENDSTGRIKAVSRAAGSLVGPLTAGSRLRVSGDTNNSMQIAQKTAGSLSGPLTLFANLRLRTDENGNILVAATAIGTVGGPITPLGDLQCRTDENGYLRVAIVP